MDILKVKEIKNLPFWWWDRKFIRVTSYWARWRLKSPASRLFTQSFVQARIKENIKAKCHWTLWGYSPVIGEFPAQWASNAETVSIWWPHHVSGMCIGKCNGCWCRSDGIDNVEWSPLHRGKITLSVYIILAYQAPDKRVKDATISLNTWKIPDKKLFCQKISLQLMLCWFDDKITDFTLID